MRSPMVDKKYLMTQYNWSLATINRRIDELEEEISRHRYPATALIRDTSVRVDPDIFASFVLNRKRLRSGARRRVNLKAL